MLSELSGQGRDSLQGIHIEAITMVPGIHNPSDTLKRPMSHIPNQA
ncbi:MAG: hypothetical protein ABSA86_15065 [Oryzomonas sp.]